MMITLAGQLLEFYLIAIVPLAPPYCSSKNTYSVFLSSFVPSLLLSLYIIIIIIIIIIIWKVLN